MFLDPAYLSESESKEAVENCKCIICTGIILDPVECSQCSNCFCKLCIEQWTLEKKTCPFRCKNPNYKPSTKLINLLSKLHFFCQNGCDKVIPYDNLIEHYSHECPNLNYKKMIEEYSNKIGQKIEEFNDIKMKIEFYKNINENLKFGGKPPRQIYIPRHPHLLKFSSRSNSWICDICRNCYSSEIKSFYCKECDFDYCCECYINDFFNFQ